MKDCKSCWHGGINYPVCTCPCHSSHNVEGEKKPLDARACAERIVYLHGTLHMNDILPDLRELVEATEERVARELLAEITSDAEKGFDPATTLGNIKAHLLSRLQGKNGEAKQ